MLGPVSRELKIYPICHTTQQGAHNEYHPQKDPGSLGDYLSHQFGRLNWIIATEFLHSLVLGKLIVDIVFYVIECQIVELSFGSRQKAFSKTGHD